MAKNADACGEHDDENPRKTAASKIFDTARDLFYRRGIRAVGVDEIVCEAGVTKPSLYRAFKSKDELVAACLRESAREGKAAVLGVLAAAGDDPRARLDALFRHYAGKLDLPDFRGCLMSNVAVELPEPDHPGREVLATCKTEMREVIAGLVRDLGVSEAEELADGLTLVIEGSIASHHIFGRDGPARSLVATCECLVEAYLERSTCAVA